VFGSDGSVLVGEEKTDDKLDVKRWLDEEALDTLYLPSLSSISVQLGALLQPLE
jgi:hypothetical protein